MNSHRTILVLSGHDRPGALDEISSFLAERGGAIEDSQVCNLHGTFSMICLVAGAADAIARIRADLPRLAAAHDFDARAREPRGSQASVDTFPYTLKITARRQLDVIQRVSHLMRVLHINIQDVETRLVRDGAGDAMRFDIRLLLDVPRQTPVTMLRDYLQQLLGEMNVEWTLAAL